MKEKGMKERHRENVLLVKFSISLVNLVTISKKKKEHKKINIYITNIIKTLHL